MHTRDSSFSVHRAPPGLAQPGRDDSVLLREQAQHCLARGDVELAEDLLWLVVQRAPADAPGAVLLARLLVQRDGLRLAEQVIAAAALRCPGHPLLLLAEGEILMHQERFEAAEERFRLGQAAGAPRRAVWAGLARVCVAQGNVWLRDGRLHEAAFRFRRAASLDPRWAEPRAQLAEALLLLGQRRRAAALALEAASLAPRSAEVQYRLGCVLRDAGAVDAASAALDRALRADPVHLRARRALADLLVSRQPARALLLYAEEVSRSPADALLWSSMGELCLRLRDLRQAARCFRESLRLDGSNLPVRTLLQDLERSPSCREKRAARRTVRPPVRNLAPAVVSK